MVVSFNFFLMDLLYSYRFCLMLFDMTILKFSTQWDFFNGFLVNNF